MSRNLPMEKLINFRLFLFLAVSLALGICSAYSFILQKIGLGIAIIVFFILLLLIYLLFFTAKEKRIKSIIFISIFATIFGIGASVFSLQIANYNAVNLGDHYYEMEGVIAEEHITDYGAKYILKDVKVNGNVKGTLNYKVELYVYGAPTYKLGDVIAFSEYLFDKDLYYEGRFSSYSIADKVKYRVTIYDTDIKLVSSSPNLFEKTNLMIKENLSKGLSEKTFPVAYAMLTGNSDYMDLDVLNSYRRAGVAHIFAVSGLHIGFIAAILNFVFNKMRLNRVVKAVLVTLALLFYSGVCGFSASSLRATVMAAVLLFAAIKGEKYDGVSAVAVAAFLILLFNPAELFCVGFQLSFTVVFGILILGKPLSKIFKFLPRKIAESIGTVISAQLFGGLICIATFGTTSLISIIANLIFIPVVSVIFTAALIAVILSEIIGLHSILFFLIDLAFRVINLLIKH